MKVLLTGASGFLGKAIFEELESSQELITLGRSPSNRIQADLRRGTLELPEVDMIVHAAGKAHTTPKSKAEIEEFFLVNTRGTENLLNSLNSKLPKSFVFISSVAVYGREEGANIDENHPLLGVTPYARSKIEAESLILEWGNRNRVPIVILRLPLISGTNPPGNLKALARAIESGYYLRIGRGEAKKSMVAASDVAKLLHLLQGKYGIYNLTDGRNPDLFSIENQISNQFGKKIRSLPLHPIKIAARLGDLLPFSPINSLRLKKLTASLTFSDSLARKELGWNPSPALNVLIFSNA